MRWVIEKDRFDEGYENQIREAFKELCVEEEDERYRQSPDHGFVFHKYIPFEDPKKYIHYAGTYCKTAVYGSINLLKSVAGLPWTPGNGTTFDNYRCSTYYPILRGHLLNEGGVWMPYRELIQRGEFPCIETAYARPEHMFVRPDEATKAFTGDVYTIRELSKQVTDGSDFMVYIAYPQSSIQWEWRFYIVDKQIITQSMYKENKRKQIGPQRPKGLRKEVAKIINLYQPDDCFCVDVCVSNGLFKVVELSPLHCAGLYAADVKKLFIAMHKFYSERGEEKDG
jgi:hypothetical protein